MSLRLGTGAEANTGDTITTLNGHAVGGEGPLIGEGTTLALLSSQLRGHQTLRAPQTVVSINESLHVGSGLLVDPSGEEALRLVHMTGPCGTIIHVHGHLHVLGVLLAGGQILDLLEAGLIGLTCGHAAVDGDGAAISHGAAGGGGVEDLRGGAGTATQKTGILIVLGVILGIQHLHQTLDLLIVACVVLVEVTDVQQDLCHLVDGVVAALGSRAVAGDAADIHTDLHTTAVTAIDTAVGRLGGDDELDLAAGILGAVKVLVDDGLPAHTVAVLFLHSAHHHQLIALRQETQILHDLTAVSSGGHAALLIGAAATVDNVVGLVALVGIMLPVVDVADAHGVDVAVDGDDLVTVAQPADHVAQLVDLHLVIAKSFQLLCDAADDALFLAALAGDRDHIPQEAAHSRLVTFSSFFDGFEIHNMYLHSNCISCVLTNNFYMSCTGNLCNSHPYNSTVTADVKQKFIKPKKFF